MLTTPFGFNEVYASFLYQRLTFPSTLEQMHQTSSLVGVSPVNELILHLYGSQQLWEMFSHITQYTSHSAASFVDRICLIKVVSTGRHLEILSLRDI